MFILPLLMTLIFAGASLTDATIDYQECKAKEFKGFANDKSTSCKSMEKLYVYDKDSKSVKKIK